MLEDIIESDDLFELELNEQPLPTAEEVAAFIREKNQGDLGQMKLVELIVLAATKGHPDTVIFYASAFSFFMGRPLGRYAKRELVQLIDKQREFMQ